MAIVVQRTINGEYDKITAAVKETEARLIADALNEFTGMNSLRPLPSPD